MLPAGQNGVLVELDDLDQVLALHASLSADPVAAVTETVPAARTLLVLFDPHRTTGQAIATAIAARELHAAERKQRRIVEIPVRYDGQDLDEVAALTGLARDEIITRHTGTLWRAAFAGFAPGFVYLTVGDPALNVPRRQSPRTAIPAGSVALAGEFSAVYPKQSPGGWQIIGTTPQTMWDSDRDPPAWLMPGDEVRFVDQASQPNPARRPAARPRAEPAPRPEARLDILAAPFPLIFQDAGRDGQLPQGIAASGAVDQGEYRALNRMLGNPAGTAAIEFPGGGVRLRAAAPCVIGLTGAGREVTLNDRQTQPSHAPIALDAGDELLIGGPERGVYGYLGARGGFAVREVLGSAATDTLAGIGPEPLTRGDWIGLAQARAGSVGTPLTPLFLPAPDDLVMIDVVMGPRSDWFPPEMLDRFTAQEWRVTARSSRIGKRLEGAAPLRRDDQRELPSEGTVTGAIQVPHSGQPVLFLADHPLTGGYPVIAVVAAHHLDLCAQIPPGARLQFRPLGPFAEIAPRRGGPTSHEAER